MHKTANYVTKISQCSKFCNICSNREVLIKLRFSHL